jgi:hypothetical protein
MTISRAGKSVQAERAREKRYGNREAGCGERRSRFNGASLGEQEGQLGPKGVSQHHNARTREISLRCSWPMALQVHRTLTSVQTLCKSRPPGLELTHVPGPPAQRVPPCAWVPDGV